MRTEIKKGEVTVSLARHERQTPATIIINKLNKHKKARDIVPIKGATVRIEGGCGKGWVFLYNLRPDQFKPLTEW